MTRSPDTIPLPASTRPPGAAWPWVAFLAINTVILAIFFWPAIAGQAMLAPLDIPPNFFSKFRYVDPNASGVPANHYVVDLMLGDVSRNLLVHKAWQQGAMPWWDPYTEGGKPLAAEANAVNVSDPFKVVLFHLLPFESAYNWIRIVPFLLSGFFAFLLLRHWGFDFAPAFWGGLLYEFAGCNAMMFSGPTCQATFVYYPLLWLLWDRGLGEGKLSWFLVSSLISALIFLSGNLQSHSYLFLFALTFTLGYGWRQRNRWVLLLSGIGFSTGIGLGLAAAFVASQVELFFLSAHSPIPYNALAGLFSLSAFFPWVLGTFRTLDASKLVAQGGLGFWIYIGSAALVLSLLGAISRTAPGTRMADVKRTALLLVGLYFLICSTPLMPIFYTRTAWLAVLGLIILFALGWRHLLETPRPMRRTGAVVAGAAILIVVGLHLGASILYPKVRPKIERRLLTQDANNPASESVPVLRRFQLANLPNEITFKNPETVVAFSGLIALGVFLIWRPRGAQLWLNGTLLLSTLPLLWYAHRFIPMQSMSLWHGIRAGGPEQRRVVEAINPSASRLMERAPGQNETLFPGAMAQIFGVHVLHGHSSMVLKHAGNTVTNFGAGRPSIADYEYRSVNRGMERGELRQLNQTSSARFFWDGPNERQIIITRETLTRIELKISPGPSGNLIRTDTYYPGWKVVSPPENQLVPEAPCFARLHVPGDVTSVALEFEPRWWRAGLVAALISALVLAASTAVFWRRNGQTQLTNLS